MSKFFTRDANHKPMVEFLAKNRVWAYDAAHVGGGLTDLIVFCPEAETGFLEVKREGKAQFKRSQIYFMANCKAPIGYARTNEDALAFARNPRGRGLSSKQKDRLAALLVMDARKTFPAAFIEGILEKAK